MYDRNELERLLPYTWDEASSWGIPPAEEVEEGMPRAASDPTRRNTHWAVIADLHQAWSKAGLTEKQQTAVILRYGYDRSLSQIADLLKISKQSVAERVDVGVEKMLAYLNGLELYEEVNG